MHCIAGIQLPVGQNPLLTVVLSTLYSGDGALDGIDFRDGTSWVTSDVK